MPNFVTISLANEVAIEISDEAPDVTLSWPKIISSATLPPIAFDIFASMYSRVCEYLSLSGKVHTTPKALPLGIIVALCIGSEAFSFNATIAWPPSWYAVNFLSSSVITIDLLSAPIITLSLASSMSDIVTILLFFLAANNADSLHKFAKSAPENPGVPLAIVLNFTSGPMVICLIWTFKIASLPIISGLETTTCLSNLPGLSNAGSNTSGLFVAAIIITPSLVSKPSISTNNWLSVCSLSSFPPPRPAPLLLPTASISSIKIIQGAFFLPCSIMSLTLEAPTPTNISTKSDPEIVKKGTLASPAIALANNVFPVPGGPIKRAPRGIFPPSFLNFVGFFKNSTISSTSSFASSIPATSLKVTFPLVSDKSFALDFPNPIAPPFPPCIWRIKNTQTPIRRSIGNQDKRTPNKDGILSSRGEAVMFTPFEVNFSTRFGSFGA